MSRIRLLGRRLRVRRAERALLSFACCSPEQSTTKIPTPPTRRQETNLRLMLGLSAPTCLSSWVFLLACAASTDLVRIGQYFGRSAHCNVWRVGLSCLCQQHGGKHASKHLSPLRVAARAEPRPASRDISRLGPRPTWLPRESLTRSAEASRSTVAGASRGGYSWARPSRAHKRSRSSSAAWLCQVGGSWMLGSWGSRPSTRAAP